MRVVSVLFFLFLFLWADAAQAQSPRDVLLNVCNDTPNAVAIAAAYRTSSAPTRTLRNWFLVEPGACLDGALNNVAGPNLALHAASGEWFWPTGTGDHTLCVPAAGGFSLAQPPECAATARARAFKDLTIYPSRYPGIGQVEWRIRCGSLPAEDAALCPLAPPDERGMAQPVREFEVCSSAPAARRLGVTARRENGSFEPVRWFDLGVQECAIAFRGFPADRQIVLIEPHLSLDDASICLSGEPGEIPHEGRFIDGGAGCTSAGQREHRYRIVESGVRTHRLSVFVQ